ncbi:MAG TPA: glycosyltransferase [Rudaea sp.]
MHLADLTLFFAPHSGGVKRYLLAKHRFLARQDEVRHSLLVPGAATAQIEPGIYQIAATRIPYGGGYRIPFAGWRWSRKLRDLAPDVIEVGDPYHLGWFALGAADDIGAATVAFVHSDLPRMLALRFGRSIGRVADAYVRRFYARFDLVMAPSKLIARRLRSAGVERAVVQPLGVDGDCFHPSRRDPGLRAELCLPADTRLLVFAGRLAREKQIPLLLDTFGALGQPYHLLLIGGEERKRLADNVTLLPYEQDSVRLARRIASADALVHAGVHETFGMIVIEAMACGIPVIGLRAGAVAELIDDRVGALCDPDKPAALREAIAALYERDLAAMGAAARARIEKRYTWASAFGQQLDRYARLSHRMPIVDADVDVDLETADAAG